MGDPDDGASIRAYKNFTTEGRNNLADISRGWVYVEQSYRRVASCFFPLKTARAVDRALSIVSYFLTIPGRAHFDNSRRVGPRGRNKNRFQIFLLELSLSSLSLSPASFSSSSSFFVPPSSRALERSGHEPLAKWKKNSRSQEREGDMESKHSCGSRDKVDPLIIPPAGAIKAGNLTLSCPHRK